jgi:hypothetical protein
MRTMFAGLLLIAVCASVTCPGKDTGTTLLAR